MVVYDWCGVNRKLSREVLILVGVLLMSLQTLNLQDPLVGEKLC